MPRSVESAVLPSAQKETSRTSKEPEVRKECAGQPDVDVQRRIVLKVLPRSSSMPDFYTTDLWAHTSPQELSVSRASLNQHQECHPAKSQRVIVEEAKIEIEGLNLGGYRPNLADKPFQKWASEFWYLVLGFVAMTTLVVLLAYNDRKPLQPWVFGVTLNGVIAVISFMWKASLSSVCAGCIGQLKWQWFQEKRPLIDMELLDEASRGGAFSVRCLFRIPLTQARIAGLLVGLTMAFDPFVQQLVSFPMTTTWTMSQNATATRGIAYTMGPPNVASVQGNLKAGREDQYFADGIVTAVLFREVNYIESFYASRGIACPSPFNCTWDEFATLGLCYRIAELSEADWQTDCRADNGSGCSYDIHGATRIKIEANYIFESKEVPANISQHWFDISNPLLTLVSLKRHNNTNVGYKVINMTVTSFYPCVYTAVTNAINGVYSFHIIDSWRNESAQVPSNNLTAHLPDIFMTPSQSELHLDGKAFEPATYHIPGPVADLMRTTLRSTLVVRAGFSSNGSTQADFAYAGYGNSKLVASSFLNIAGQWEVIFRSVVLGATSYIRSIRENQQHAVAGYQVAHFNIINVRWKWIILHLGVFVSTIIFLIITVRANRSLPAYKNSILPLFFLPKLQGTETLNKPFRKHEMVEKARSTPVNIGLRSKI